MNIVIEIIDGVPYKVAAVSEMDAPCDKCVLDGSPKCAKGQVCNEQSGFNRNYQYLTSRDRAKVLKLLEGGDREKPRRNCDVGTQDEIVGRFVDYCASQKLCPAWESCRICLVRWMLDTYKESE